MSQPEHTCWTVIRGAARREEADVRGFVDRYGGIVEAYLRARWRRPPLAGLVDDAVQEVFIECFRDGGVLTTAQEDRVANFRAFLLGCVRNIARRFETERVRRDEREAPAATGFDAADPRGEEKQLSRVFDRAWAEALVRQAAERQAERARSMGAEAEERVELLRLHFHDGVPVREIASKWKRELKATHHALDRARAEFQEALEDVIRFHYPGERRAVEAEVRRLLELIAR